MSSAGAKLDIIIPVYNEGAGIVRVLDALRSRVRTPFRVLICYDFDEDDTLPAIAGADTGGIAVHLVKNTGRGPHQAIMAGFDESSAPFVLVYPADDDFNAGIVDQLVSRAEAGADIVCPSRLMKGGRMVGAPLLKSVIVHASNFALHHVAGLPTHDASNGFRLFTRRVLDTIPIESTEGFTYSIELLVKSQRLGWRIEEVPASWYERSTGTSRFRVVQWLPAYLRWFLYAFATKYLGRRDVPRRVHLPPADPASHLTTP